MRQGKAICNVTATMAYVNTACAVCLSIFSTGSKFRLVVNFMELHTLTQAIHSYVLLVIYVPHP